MSSQIVKGTYGTISEEGDQFTATIACCELVPVELAAYKSDFDFFDEDQYPYSPDDEYQYPSASASYSGKDCEENIVSLLNADFLDIYDELARDDGSFVFGSSAVALPVIYAMTEAEFVLPETASKEMQHATLIETSEPKILKQESGCDKVVHHSSRIQKDNRTAAIMKWRRKKTQGTGKSVEKCAMSARQEATARRPREPHGKFRKVKAKWIAATEYFHREPPMDALEEGSDQTLNHKIDEKNWT